MAFLAGDFVVLRELKGKPELNEAYGRVLDAAVAQDRVPVQVEYRAHPSAKPMALKPENLRLLASLDDTLQALVATQRPLSQPDDASDKLVPAKRRKTSRRLRVCSSNVPPKLATNKVVRGEQVLGGVVKDPGDEQWRARVVTMAQQLREVDAAVVLHQEVNGAKLEELVGAADCGLQTVDSSWNCPISYQSNLLQPVFADRLIVGSAPSKFLGPGVCKCHFGQWSYSACRCWPSEDETRAGGASFAAFRFVDSPTGRVDLVAVSVHLTDRNPEVRTWGAREVLVPLVRLLRERFDDSPVVLGGDFNMTKLQSSDKMDKRAGGAGWKPGAYDVLVGSHEANRRMLKRPQDVEGFVQRGHDPDSSYEDDDDGLEAPAPTCVDTWELAHALGKSKANGCMASTCHNWFGLSKSFQRYQCNTQGPGANSIDVFDDEGEQIGSKAQKHSVNTVGSARYIDWLLVDLASLQQKRVEVLGTTVHTAPGTRDFKVMVKLPKPWGGSNGTGRTYFGGTQHGEDGGYGSDHFPISVDLALHVEL